MSNCGDVHIVILNYEYLIISGIVLTLLTVEEGVDIINRGDCISSV